MKIGFTKCSRTQRWLWTLALFMTGSTLFVQLLLPAQWQLHCRFHALTGLPCPACGASRCGALLIIGHLREAAHMQPLFFGLVVLLLPLMLYALPALLMNWPLPRIQMESGKERIQLTLGMATLILANWAYLIFQHA